MIGELNGEPISSSGLATKVMAGSLAGLAQRGDGVQSRQQPGLHVGHARPGRAVATGPIRPRGSRSRVEDGVHVADEQQPRAVAGEPTDDEVPELRPAFGRMVGDALDLRAELGERIGHDVRDPVDALGRVRAAVDVDQRLELGEEARQARVDDAPQRVRVGHGDQYTHAHAARRRPPGPQRRAGRAAGARRAEPLPPAPGGEARVRRRAAGRGRCRGRPGRAGDQAAPQALDLPQPRIATRRSVDELRVAIAFGWRRRTISQAIAAAAGRLALGRSNGRRELAGLRATAHGPLSQLPKSRIPIVAVTGTNGKTTTTRLIAHVASESGLKVGMTNSDGIFVRGKLIEAGDWSGSVVPGACWPSLVSISPCSRPPAVESCCAASATRPTT